MPLERPPARVAFPGKTDEERRARELEHRLNLMGEVCRIIAERAVHHAAKALAHQGYWLEDWQTGKAQRLHELARILGSVEFAGFIRGTPALRALFSQHVPPPLPKRPRATNTRRRSKPVDVLDPTTWGEFDLLAALSGIKNER